MQELKNSAVNVAASGAVGFGGVALGLAVPVAVVASLLIFRSLNLNSSSSKK